MHESKLLELFDNAAVKTETRTQRFSRNRAFKKRLIEIYEKKCALCSRGLIHPIKGVEVHGAHIVPRKLKGADDARNGLSLCRTHHWAFDEGLFGVTANGTILVPNRVKAIDQNKELATFDSKHLSPPTVDRLKPATEALAWHLANVVQKP